MTREEFLNRYLTVVGKNKAIEDNDKTFIQRYLTVVGCPGSGSGSGSGDYGEIHYTATSKVTPYSTSVFGANYLAGESTFNSTTGEGVLMFDGDVTNVGNQAFFDRPKLKSIVIPDGVTNIGTMAFKKCNYITSVTIPEGVTNIGSGAFDECKRLTSVTIPNSVTNIGAYAFKYCPITSVIIPEGVTNIGSGAFQYCRSLSSISYTGTKDQWNAITIGTDWHTSVPATVVHCTDGDVNI